MGIDYEGIRQAGKEAEAARTCNKKREKKREYRARLSKNFPTLNNRQVEWLRGKYNLTDEQILQYINATYCALCGKKFKNTRSRHQDHCHITGKIRGVICVECNTRLGWLEAVGIVKVVEYLKGYEESQHHID